MTRTWSRKTTPAGKLSWRAVRRSVTRFWGSWGLPCRVSETLPGTLPSVPARVRARVQACRGLSPGI
eukprot:4492973-Pyramimonas_sp.AAC.1